MAKLPALRAPPRIPSPPSNLDHLVTRLSWPRDDVFHRIHPAAFGAEQFNPGPKGNARFSPIADAAANAIPTIYGGTSFSCAAMETVFHDVPFRPGFKPVAKRKLRDHLYSQVRPNADLVLADLSVTALRKLGVTRGQLIDSEKVAYPQTRPWAEAIHAQCPDIQGLCWVSRQDDRALAVMLFGDRISAPALTPTAGSRDIIADTAVYADIVDLAERIGVKIYG